MQFPPPPPSPDHGPLPAGPPAAPASGGRPAALVHSPYSFQGPRQVAAVPVVHDDPANPPPAPPSFFELPGLGDPRSTAIGHALPAPPSLARSLPLPSPPLPPPPPFASLPPPLPASPDVPPYVLAGITALHRHAAPPAAPLLYAPKDVAQPPSPPMLMAEVLRWATGYSGGSVAAGPPGAWLGGGRPVVVGPPLTAPPPGRPPPGRRPTHAFAPANLALGCPFPGPPWAPLPGDQHDLVGPALPQRPSQPYRVAPLGGTPFASCSVPDGTPFVGNIPCDPLALGGDEDTESTSASSEGQEVYQYGNPSPTCAHPKPWKKLRAKRGYKFFVCRHCAARWRLRGAAKRGASTAPHPTGPDLAGPAP